MMTQLIQLCSMTMYVSPTFTRHFKREIQVQALNFKSARYSKVECDIRRELVSVVAVKSLR